MIERCGHCGVFYCHGDCYAADPAKGPTSVPDPEAAREMNRIMQDQRPFFDTPEKPS